MDDIRVAGLCVRVGLLWLMAGVTACSDMTNDEEARTCADQPDAGASDQDPEDSVTAAVRAYYADFNSSFECAEPATTTDWNHVGPAGGWTRGRDAVIAKIQDVREHVLHDATKQLDELEVRFMTDDVAVVIATSHFEAADSGPDARAKLLQLPPSESLRSTFVLVERDHQWQLMQSQDTWMGTPAADLPHSDALGKPVGDELTSGPEPDEDTVNAVLAALDAANAPDDFDKADYAAADWTFISPGGELYPGREATLRLFRELEDEDFMQGGGFTIENRSLRFASDDVAVVTETGVSDPFVAPNGVKNSAQRAQTTSVFVNGEQGWLLRHTHMTIVTDG